MLVGQSPEHIDRQHTGSVPPRVTQQAAILAPLACLKNERTSAERRAISASVAVMR